MNAEPFQVKNVGPDWLRQLSSNQNDAALVTLLIRQISYRQSDYTSAQSAFRFVLFSFIGNPFPLKNIKKSPYVPIF